MNKVSLSKTTASDENSTENPGWVRWAVLISMSLLVFGGYFVYDTISPMKNALETELGISPTDFGWLVSFYAVPNLLGITILGGLLMDKKGIRFTGLIFSLLCVAGAFITAFGASDFFRESFLHTSLNNVIPGWSGEVFTMVLGRFIFGFGGETIIVAQNKIISRWFKDRELAFAFGINLVICRLGTVSAISFSSLILGSMATLQMEYSPLLPGLITMKQVGISNALWLSSIIMILSFISFLVYLTIDKTYGGNIEKPSYKDDDSIAKNILNLIKIKPFIYLTVLSFTFYSAVFPFLSYATDILLNKYSLSVGLSGILTSIVTWTTIVFTPLGGLFIDRFGKRVSMMIIGAIILITVFVLIGFTSIPPYIPMAFLGLAFSIVPAAIWPSVPMIVPSNMLGTAYGIMAQIQNAGLWAIPLLMGFILKKSNSEITPEMVRLGEKQWNYTNVIILMIIIGIISLIFAILLKKSDGSEDSFNLEKPHKQ